MSVNPSPAPLGDPVVGPDKRITVPWETYLRGRDTQIQATATILKAVALESQAAAIALTPFSTATLSAGLYRVSYHAKVTTAATTSSALTVTVTYTRNAATCSQVGSTVSGNTTSTVGSGSFTLHIDRATAISYQTTYLSAGATSMAYDLDLVLELIAVSS